MSHNRDQAPRNADTPIPGFYRVRRGRGGAYVPAEIVCNHGLWSVFLADQPTGPSNPEPWLVPHMEWVAFGARITEDEHAEMMKLGTPHSIDWNNAAPIF